MSPYLSGEQPATTNAEPKFRPGINVGIIGAGVSGINTAAYLKKQGADVTVFERSGVISGVWHYDARAPHSPSYPSQTPSAGDYTTSKPGQFSSNGTPSATSETNGEAQHPLLAKEQDAREVAFAPPGPCYAGLRNNVPTSLLYSKLGNWPEGTEDITDHYTIEKYIQDLASAHGVNENIEFHTRVEEAHKAADGGWELRTITAVKSDNGPAFKEAFWRFDALVVASGHYNLPRIPDTPGLAEWKKHFGNRIIHTKEYRRPEDFKDQKLLVIGGGASGMDVCRETIGSAAAVVHSTRGGAFDVPKAVIPEAVQAVGAIEKFVLNTDASGEQTLNSSDPVPGHVLLQDGTTVDNLHAVVLATGYLTSYPFLSQLHADGAAEEAVGPDNLVAQEGTMTHNLHKDIFYIRDPSLAFIGVPYYTATFSLFDFQAQALARVFTGKARLPTEESMRTEYNERLARKGLGRKFHSLAEDGAEVNYVNDLLESVNSATVDAKLEPLKGHDEKWLEAYRNRKQLKHLLKQKEEGHNAEATWP